MHVIASVRALVQIVGRLYAKMPADPESCNQYLTSLTGNVRYLESARRAVTAFGGSMADQPVAFGALLVALEELLAPPATVVLRGDARQFESWRRAFALNYQPATAFLATDAPSADLPEALAKPAPASGVHAFVCRGTTCLAPVDRIDGLLSALAVA